MNCTFHSVVCAPEGSTMVPLPNSTNKEPQESMKKVNKRMEINSHRPGLTFDLPPFFVSERSSITAVRRYHLPSCSLCRYLETREALHEVSISQDPSRRRRSAHFHRTVHRWALTPFTSFTSPWKPICSAVPLSLTRMDFVHFKHLHYSCIRKDATAN